MNENEWIDNLPPHVRREVERITDDAGTWDADAAVLAAAGKLLAEAVATLRRCESLCRHLTQENTGLRRYLVSRWPINHEPLRADAANLLPDIRAAIGEPSRNA